MRPETFGVFAVKVVKYGARKPHVFDTNPNRAFPRGFPATHFSDLCLCVRLRVLVAIFGALSLHPKIPFPAAGFGREVRAQLQPCSGLCTAVIRDLGPALQLFRIESERLKLRPPLCVRYETAPA